jgi:hypothetical protein
MSNFPSCRIQKKTIENPAPCRTGRIGLSLTQRPLAIYFRGKSTSVLHTVCKLYFPMIISGLTDETVLHAIRWHRFRMRKSARATVRRDPRYCRSRRRGFAIEELEQMKSMAKVSSRSHISNETKLYCTLRWLSGGSYLDICFAWGVGRKTPPTEKKAAFETPHAKQMSRYDPPDTHLNVQYNLVSLLI